MPEQVLVIGEGRSFLAAMLVLNPERWNDLAGELGLDPQDPESLRQQRARHAVQKRVAAALKDFPGYAKVRRVIPLIEPWSVDNGLLTPTLTVKRAKVLDRYAEAIDALYTNGPVKRKG